MKEKQEWQETQTSVSDWRAKGARVKSSRCKVYVPLIERAVLLELGTDCFLFSIPARQLHLVSFEAYMGVAIQHPSSLMSFLLLLLSLDYIFCSL